ncbi:MAG: 30S ribosomal protein S6 [Verrucomicrobiae bacterium]|nr:30S ribosomal protein S6 [Verrucomicrobiae bacterium]
MKRYEALFILNTNGKEESVQELVDRIKGDLQKSGAQVSSVQKLDRKQFAYKAGSGETSGFYVNYVLEASAEVVDKLKNRFRIDEDVMRVQITHSPLHVQPVATN